VTVPALNVDKLAAKLSGLRFAPRTRIGVRAGFGSPGSITSGSVMGGSGASPGFSIGGGAGSGTGGKSPGGTPGLGAGGFLVLAKVCQQQEHPGQTFLTRIEQLIDEVCLDADGPRQTMGNEHPGERWLLLDHADNSRFFQAHDDGVRHRRDRRYALRLPGKTSSDRLTCRNTYERVRRWRRPNTSEAARKSSKPGLSIDATAVQACLFPTCDHLS
jgi:hypothetical protein